MERVADPARTAEAEQTCPGCARAVAEARCGYCGAVTEAGRWKIDRVLAQTPHSRVYVAHDDTGQRVALKELHFAAVPSAEQLEAFEREAKTLEALSHPRIPKFRQTFTVGQGVHLRLYLACELIEGESLAARLARGPLPDAELRAVAEAALDALAHLHARTPAVVHRDVKPENLVFQADGTLCLVDFGSVREISGSRTHRSTLVGTFGYMPPEQLGGTVDCSSDVYALGATLLHAVTGQAPQALDPKVPRSAPGWLKAWLPGALARDPKKRYRTAAEAQRALAHPSVLQRQVHPAWLALPAAFAIALGAGVYRDVLDRQNAEWANPSTATTGNAWFDAVRSRCNSVEVAQALQHTPPPAGVEGQGYGAACFALGNKMPQARALIDRLPDAERHRAAGIVFGVAHPIADQGDDESTAPIMKLVVDYWPNHFMALYHLGVAEYGAGDMPGAKDHLQRFLALYAAPDAFTASARRALSAIEKGPPYAPLNAAR